MLKTNLSKRIELERAKQTIENDTKITIDDIQNQIAKYCELNVNTIISIKTGRCKPSIVTALKIAKYFDCKVEDIFSLDGSE